MGRHLVALSLLLIGVALTGCGNNNPLYAPNKNPNPKYFMTVKGHIDPELAKSISLQLLPEYEANNSDCKYTINSFEGVSAPVYRDLTFIAKPDKNGGYEVKIPIDYYLAGRCDWNMRSIDYQLIGTNYSSRGIADFNVSNESLPIISAFKSTQISCDKKLTCHWNKVEFHDQPLRNNQSYVYQLDISEK